MSIRSATITWSIKKAGEVCLTMTPEGKRSYSVVRDLYNGDALQTLCRWGAEKPRHALSESVREGSATVKC